MNKKEPPSLIELRRIIAELRALPVRENELTEQLRGIPAKIAEEVQADDERWRLANELYWRVPELNYYYLARDLFRISKKRFEAAVSPIDSGLACDECGQTVQYLNKEHKKAVEWRAGGRLLCDRCFEGLTSIHAQKHALKKREFEAWQQQLTEMPFRKYLQTQAWQQRRGRHLDECRYRCQICSREAFDVYHREDEGRGNEEPTHLLALCPECYEANKRNDILIEK